MRETEDFRRAAALLAAQDDTQFRQNIGYGEGAVSALQIWSDVRIQVIGIPPPNLAFIAGVPSSLTWVKELSRVRVHVGPRVWGKYLSMVPRATLAGISEDEAIAILRVFYEG